MHGRLRGVKTRLQDSGTFVPVPVRTMGLQQHRCQQRPRNLAVAHGVMLGVNQSAVALEVWLPGRERSRLKRKPGLRPRRADL
jgi:hypothetical protein